jgi:hypothetical protein
MIEKRKRRAAAFGCGLKAALVFYPENTLQSWVVGQDFTPDKIG